MNPPTTSTLPPFLKLARELRDQIYSYAIANDQICVDHSSEGVQLTSTHPFWFVNKQVRAEYCEAVMREGYNIKLHHVSINHVASISRPMRRRSDLIPSSAGAAKDLVINLTIDCFELRPEPEPLHLQEVLRRSVGNMSCQIHQRIPAGVERIVVNMRFLDLPCHCHPGASSQCEPCNASKGTVRTVCTPSAGLREWCIMNGDFGIYSSWFKFQEPGADVEEVFDAEKEEHQDWRRFLEEMGVQVGVQ